MKEELKDKINEAKKHQKENKLLVKKIKKIKPKNLDDVFHQLHDDAFDEIDCLACANCCKTTSPIFYQKDIERLSKSLKIKPSVFIEKYLKIDEDDDYVFKFAPCPFLGDDNYCSVYGNRPTACKEYPHTNRKKTYQLLNLSLNNTEICPAVAYIFEQLKQRIS